MEFVEFVEINTTFDVDGFRELKVELVSPPGAVSVLAPVVDPELLCSDFGFLFDPCQLHGSFRFGSARHLGENPKGTWTLRVTDHVTGKTPGTLDSWSLTVYGHRSTPAAPAIDSVTTGNNALDVAWTAPDNVGASAITAYDLRYIRSDASDKADANWSVVDDAWTSGALTASLSSLSNAVMYDVQVRAVNEGGDGLWSAVETGTPTTDEAPTIDSVMPGDRSITVEWTAPTNATLGTITSYDLRYIRSDATNKADGNWTTVASIWTSGAREYTLSPTTNPLVNGVSYDVQVRAITGTVERPWSGAEVATPRTTPDSPTIDSVTPDEEKLTVEWSAPANDGGADVTSYDVRSIRSDATDKADASWDVEAGAWTSGVLSYTVAGLTNGIEYDVQVRAVNVAGGGGWSATTAGTPRTVPDAPTIDSVTGGQRALTVKWSAPASTGGAAITSYDLRHIRSDAADKADPFWPMTGGLGTSGDLEYTATTGLDVGTQYDVQVRALNDAGWGAWSDTKVAETARSDDATLSGLTLTSARLTPAFSGGRISYTASVGYTVTRITIDATKSDDNASVEFRDGNDAILFDADSAGGFQVDLSVGENVIKVEVTAQDGVTTETYTLTVTRTAEDPSLNPGAGDPVPASASSAVYTITFQGAWTTAVTPGGVPGGAHFSPLIGAVHNAGVTFLESGGTASAGVESMAEIGGTSTLRGEVRAAVNATPATALAVISRSGNVGGTAKVLINNVKVTSEYPRVTLTTMIAPSHDWFVGVSGLPLLDVSGRWLRSHEVDLFPWDAGTEEGNDFSLSPSVDTVPRGVITSIRGTGKFTIEPIATLTFSLQSIETERSVVENTPAGVNVGPRVTAAETGGMVAYTLGGTDAGSFDLNASTGQLRTKAGVTYDHETKDSYTVTVTATDSDGSVVTTVTITVTDIDEQPEITGQTAVELAENRTGTVARYRVSDPEGEAVTWLSPAGADSSAFDLSDGGALTFRSPPDHEAQEEYQLMLRASDGGLTGTLHVTITVTDVDEPPEVTGEPHVSIEENSTDFVGFYSASDPEDVATTWTALSGSDRTHFVLSEFGELRFKTAPDFDAWADANRDNRYQVRVGASDGSLTDTLDVTVTVTNVNEPPAISGPASVNYAEHGAGTVATYGVTDPERGTVIWEALEGTDRDAFTFSGGVLRFKTPPDFEDPTDAGGDNEYVVTLRASDGEHMPTFTVTVEVENEEETGALALSSEQPQVGALLTTTLADPDGSIRSESWSWERSRNRSTWTTISGQTQSSYTPADADLNRYLRVTVEYSDGEGSGKSKAETSDQRTQVAPPMNYPPEFTGVDPNRSVAENSREGVAVGDAVTATDANNDRLTYTLDDNDGALFTIDGNGRIRVGEGAVLDHEDPNANFYSVTVTATDPSTASDSILVDITVTDVNEAPEAVRDDATTVEDESVTIEVLSNDDDPDAGDPNDTLTVSLRTRPANGVAAVDAATNDITYTPRANYHGADSFTYTVSDDDGLTSERATVNVTVDSVNDAPEFPPAAAERTVSRTAQAGANVGRPITGTDIEGDTLIYELSGADAAAFAFNAQTAQITVRSGTVLDPEVQPAYAVTVTATEVRTDALLPLTASVDVTISVTTPRRGGGGGGGGFGGPILLVTAVVAGESAPANLSFGFAYTCANTRGELLSTRTFTVAAGRTFGLLVAAGLSCSLTVSDDGGATAVDGLFTDVVILPAGYRTTVTFTFGPAPTVATAVPLDAETVVEDAGVSLTIPEGSRDAPYSVLLETDSESCEAALDLDGESLACHTVTLFDAEGAEETGVTLLVPATITITLDAARVEELGGIDGVRAARERGELRMRQRDDADTPWQELPFTVGETDDGGVEVVVTVQQFSDFSLVTATPRTQTVALHSDWNVVVWDGADGASIPDALGDIAGQVDVIYQWLAETQTWRSHRPAGPPIRSAFDTFTRGATYWIRSSDAVEWTVVGGPLEPPAAEPTRLHFRWTEVVWRGADGAPITEALGPDVLPQVEVVYRWLAETQSWGSFRPGVPAFLSAFDTFATGGSYWIAVAEEVEWTVAGGGG